MQSVFMSTGVVKCTLHNTQQLDCAQVEPQCRYLFPSRQDCVRQRSISWAASRVVRSSPSSIMRTKAVASPMTAIPVDVKELKLESTPVTDPAALWDRYVDWLYQNEELALSLDVSRISFSPRFVEVMEPKFAEAFAAMRDLEGGAIANPDEKRMVGHYWLRNADLAPRPQLKAAIDQSVAAISAFAADVLSGKIKPKGADRFTQIMSVGIGGSALGPQFVAEALAPHNPQLKIRFIDNTDPAGIDHQIAQLGHELASTLVIVTSKSGGTPETRNGLLEVQKAFRDAGLDFASQGVAITQDGSLLDNTAVLEKWIARFPMFDWVGGRTSQLSPVGLLPAALQEVDISALLKGASLMDEQTRQPTIRGNPAALLALSWYWASDGIGSKAMVVLPYKDSLLLFSRYLQQLVMESLGKERDLGGKRVHQGLAVYGNKGSTDQHAYIQQLRDGVPNFFATFIEVLRDRPELSKDWEIEPGVTCGDYLFGMLQGTRGALYAAGRESITLTIDEVSPLTVGAMIALYERAVGLYASLINVNAYHQPGVEAGKKAASQVLGLQKRVQTVINEASCRDPVESLSVEEVARRCDAVAEVEVVYKIVRHLAANERVILIAGKDGNPRNAVVVSEECPVEDDKGEEEGEVA